MAVTLDDHALGKTAQFIAACRAVESDKAPEERKFHEPCARTFATEPGMDLVRLMAEASAMSVQDLINIVTARTVFLDDVINRAVARETPKIRQLVISAVGGDGRPYRMSFPDGMVVYQMDFPDVMKYRAKVFADAGLQPTCDLRSVAVDLSKEGWVDALVAAGFNASEPSVWTVEGLVMYLTEEECKHFLSKISALCTSGSVLCGDVVGSPIFTCAKLAATNKLWLDFGAAPPVSAIDDPTGYLAQFGFKATTKIYQDLVLEFKLDCASAGPLERSDKGSELKDGKKAAEVPPLNSFFEGIKI